MLDDGDSVMRAATARLGIDLKALIAGCTVWAHPKVFRMICQIDRHGVWYPNQRRARKGEKRGEIVEGITLDDNSKANMAIKAAVFGKGRGIRKFHACHVWAGSCYDPRYHTCIANLVLIPAPLAGLSDYDAEISACLRYRSWELFGWKPEHEETPLKPDGYPSDISWMSPPDPTSNTLKYLSSIEQKQIPCPTT